jgi:hypothetical protein
MQAQEFTLWLRPEEKKEKVGPQPVAEIVEFG